MNGSGPTPAESDIAIGCFASLCRDRLADQLLALSRLAPQSGIGVHELTLTELLPAVRSGGVALAVAPEGSVEGEAALASMALWCERAVVAVAADHPLAGQRALSPDVLVDAVVLLSTDRPESEMQRYLLTRLFGTQRPPVDARPGGGEALMARVVAGEGVALVLAGHPVPTGVVTRPIAGAAACFAVRAWWRADDRSPALAILLRLLGKASD